MTVQVVELSITFTLSYGFFLLPVVTIYCEKKIYIKLKQSSYLLMVKGDEYISQNEHYSYLIITSMTGDSGQIYLMFSSGKRS